MTADLREAFHVAAIRYAAWTAWLDELDNFPCLVEGVAQDQYPPPPVVEFFGREFSIAAICDRARILEGAAPLPLGELFREIIDPDRCFECEFESYAEAVECLSDLFGNELCRVRKQPTTADVLVAKGRREGADFAFEIWSADLDAIERSGEGG